MNRIKIGLLFAFDDSWTGGVYYLTNILSALKTLPEVERPEVVLFYHNESAISQVKAIGYEPLTYLPVEIGVSRVSRFVLKAVSKLLRKRFYPQYPNNIVDFVFPATSLRFFRNGSIKNLIQIFWIPDFQHKYLPHFFSEKEY